MPNNNENMPFDFLDSSLSPSAVEEMLNSFVNEVPNILLEVPVSTPPGMKPSNENSSSSPSIFNDSFDDIFNLTPGNAVTNDSCQLHETNTASSLDSSGRSSFGSTANEYESERLQMLAEPKPFYRGRYSCEIDKVKNRAKRFIRSENKDKNHDYPTIKIPEHWSRSDQKLYIRVTLVTVPTESVPHHCIHPYAIDTPDKDVFKDSTNNSLYFGINDKEFITHEKSFQIVVNKQKQDDLKQMGPMRFFSYDQSELLVSGNPLDAKQKIATYQLWKSQFIFAIAIRQENSLAPFITIPETSVSSQIMTDQANDTTYLSRTEKGGQSAGVIKVVPQRGAWEGGDEVLILMSSPIKRKVYTVSFDFGLCGQEAVSDVRPVDSKTISFQTPPCPFQPRQEDLTAPMHIYENNIRIAVLDYVYQSPMIITRNLCPSCQIMISNTYTGNKRRCISDDYEYEQIDSVLIEMESLSLEQAAPKPQPDKSSLNDRSDGEEGKFDKYLNQLREALAIFVRTNDPSRLFRRTRVLLSKDDDASPLLNDAIQRGHIQLASSLLEQVCGMPSPNPLLEKRNEQGVTPLLMAAKCNEWGLIELMLKKRADLAEQIDDDGNNLFHILADVRDDEGADTMKKVVNLLGENVVMNVGKKPNGNGLTPMDVAKTHGNTVCLECLMEIESVRE